jgi:Methylamine utilisation protein MauE
MTGSFSIAVTADLLRSALVVMWLWSAVAKLRVLDRFVSSAIKLAGPMPMWIIRPLAHLLPIAEVCLAAVLLPNSWAPTATILSFSALVLFDAILSRAWRLRINAPCRCFGGSSDDERVTGLMVARTGFLAAVAATAALASAPGRHVLYTAPITTLGVFLGGCLLVAGSALAGTSVRLIWHVERAISKEAADT